jgi:hypothetical protein
MTESNATAFIGLDVSKKCDRAQDDKKCARKLNHGQWRPKTRTISRQCAYPLA